MNANVDDPNATLRVAFHLERRGPRQPRLRVEGLSTLGLREIEGQATFWDISPRLDQIIRQRDRRLTQVDVVQHGDTFGPAATTQFRVKLSPSFDDPTRLTYRIAPPIPTELGPKRYYHFGIDYRGNPDTATLVNLETVCRGGLVRFRVRRLKPEDDHEPDRPAWGFPEFVETPRILWDRRKGVLRDLVGFSRVFIISGAAKRVFETVDAGAFAFLLCESVLPDGSAGPETWLCLVTRAFYGAVDISRSEGVLAWRGERRFTISSRNRVYFRPEVVGAAHVFTCEEAGLSSFCDDEFRDACPTARLKGPGFMKRF